MARTASSAGDADRGGRRAPSGRAGELLQLLVGTIEEYAIFTLDVDGYVTTWNPGAGRIHGYRADDVLGRHFSCFYPEEALEAGRPDQELAIAVADGHFEDEAWRVRGDGGLFWANVVVTAMRGTDGRLVGFGKVVRDLTERKRGDDLLRESEERFRLLVTSVADYAIFLLDPDGTVASWNVGAERLKGYRADEILGRHFSRFYSEDDRRNEVPQRALERAQRDGRTETEGWRIRKDGSRFWANVVITALRGANGQLRGFAKVTRDLTERKRSEDALRGVLERERETAARLQEVDRMRSDLVAVIAHDLRGPIGVIQSLLHLLRTEWETAPDADKLENLDRIADRTATLAALVDDVFDLARIEAGQLEINAVPIDVEGIVEQVIADVRTTGTTRPISTKIDAQARAVGDERRTWQVLANLVSNALKFSEPDAPVGVTVERVGQEVVVSVSDAGPGIPAVEQAQLFQRFTRLRQSASTPGSGIGLFIARSLVEGQGGRIWVDSTPGSGSTFRFTLPAQV